MAKLGWNPTRQQREEFDAYYGDGLGPRFVFPPLPPDRCAGCKCILPATGGRLWDLRFWCEECYAAQRG